MNKKRTIVTIMGIILSTALITGVATLVTSFSQTMINYVKKETGDYHYEFSDVPADNIKYIENNRNIEDIYITQNVGYAILENSKNEYKPYLHIQSFDSKALEKLSLDLQEGRMPKNENELIISAHIEYNGGVEYKVGDTLNLNIGKRKLDGYDLNQHNPYVNEEGKMETFEAEYTKEYKIVGIIARPSYTTEEYSASGYTVITYLEDYENISGTTNIYTVYKDLNKQYETTAQILEIDVEDVKRYNIENAKYNFAKNETLIQWEILEFSDSTVAMLYSVAAIIIAIIIFTSVFCIRNSFEISITERIKQYGMLASVGTTSKQIRKNVLYEGVILGIIGIPFGILSGLFAIFILLQVVQNILGDMLGDEFTFVFQTSALAIIVSIVLCGITIYLSARKSAKKAAKVSPIDAIRNSQDIKIKKKRSLGSLKLIKKIFGIGGDIAYKNLKRNKKKYRATVISIVVSVSVFIAMSSFFTYAFKANNMYYVPKDYNMIVGPINYSIYEEIGYNNINEILSQSSVKAYSIMNSMNVNVEIAELKKHYSKKYKEIYPGAEDDESARAKSITITSLNKEEYKRFLKKIGIKYEEAKNKAILIDDMKEYVANEDGKGKYELFRIYDYKKGDTIQFEYMNGQDILKNQIEIITATDQRPMGLEGTYYYDGQLIVSEEWYKDYQEYSENNLRIFINSKDTKELATFIEDNFPDKFYIYDYEENIRQQNSMWLVIAIFIYGFITVISLIGVTSIFNTITTNMNLRSKEFANLKSIGMTKKEFNRMIRLESIFYCGKSLFFGILIGSGLSYLIYLAFVEGVEMGFLFPWKGVIISNIAVAILITVIMQYSLNKINKQNIIETIRKDNI